MSAQPYSASRLTEDGVSVVRLEDAGRNITVSIAPTVGNIAYEMVVNGKNAFWFPFDSVGAFAAAPKLVGNPFLWPWANRLDHDGFTFEGRSYALNVSLGNVRRDAFQQPIHGLSLFSPLWEVVSLSADDRGAEVVSRLDFSKHAELAAQFPFAHRVEMTYRLSEGALEVRTRVENLGAQTMPLSLGYHPYFQLHAAPRNEWRVRLAARKVWELNEKLTPTGKTRPTDEAFPGSDALSLATVTLDNVFGDLVRGEGGLARFSVEAAGEKIEVLYGPKFDTAVVYAPPVQGTPFICFEPMVGITNAFNLAHEGKYPALQSIPAGDSWQESYWIRPSGF